MIMTILIKIHNHSRTFQYSVWLKSYLFSGNLYIKKAEKYHSLTTISRRSRVREEMATVKHCSLSTRSILSSLSGLSDWTWNRPARSIDLWRKTLILFNLQKKCGVHKYGGENVKEKKRKQLSGIFLNFSWHSPSLCFVSSLSLIKYFVRGFVWI